MRCALVAFGRLGPNAAAAGPSMALIRQSASRKCPSQHSSKQGYGRVAWLINAVRTCPEHEMALVEVSEDLQSSSLHDFAVHVTPALPRLAALSAGAARRELGPLENYALAKLGGKTPCPPLDGMSLHAAVRLCETAGAVALFGPKVNLRKLSETDGLAAGGQGFADLASGPDGLAALLDRLKAGVGPRDRQDGPAVAFGRLYTLLSITTKLAEYDPFRSVASICGRPGSSPKRRPRCPTTTSTSTPKPACRSPRSFPRRSRLPRRPST
jgi:hypothetical protein